MRARTAIVASVLGAAAIGLALVAELRAEARPVLPRWVEEIHPLLGAAPEGSFARRADADPWTDFAGRRFARRRGEVERVLLVGGAAAVELAPRIERALGARAELVLAAREGYGTAQEVLLVGRFAPVLAVTRVVAIDGDELAAPAPPEDGWTPEWDWQAAALEWPLGERAARWSRLVRSALVPRRRGSASLEERQARSVRGVRSIAALARARGLELLWAPVAPGLFEDVSRATHESARSFEAPAKLLEALASEDRAK